MVHCGRPRKRALAPRECDAAKNTHREHNNGVSNTDRTCSSNNKQVFVTTTSKFLSAKNAPKNGERAEKWRRVQPMANQLKYYSHDSTDPCTNFILRNRPFTRQRRASKLAISRRPISKTNEFVVCAPFACSGGKLF